MTAAAPPALAFEGVDVAYRVGDTDRRILRGLDLTIAPGEAYGLVGESGCGKSTAAFAAVRYLARNGRISNGRILVDGQDLTSVVGRRNCATCAATRSPWSIRTRRRR